jgi:hypothetical protein
MPKLHPEAVSHVVKLMQSEAMIDRLITHEADDDDRDDAVTRLHRQIAAHLKLIKRTDMGLAYHFRKLPPNRFFPVNA